MRGIAVAVVGLVALAAVLMVNTLRLEPAPPVAAAVMLPVVDTEAAAGRLAGALRIATVSAGGPVRIDGSRWRSLHRHLASSFPRTHRLLTREIVADYSLLYTWPGSDPGLQPILLLAHQDVVPVEPGTEPAWTQPPFGGVIADGFVWGRGALDDKSSLMAQLEAVEWLLSKGFRPRRTVYLAYGHDEEIGGRAGALAVARLLESRGVRAEFSLDEGGAITLGIIGGVGRPVAMVATAEKGYVSLRLIARAEGGHSSKPPAVTAIGQLARAVARLEQDPWPARLVPPVEALLERVAPALPLARRIAVANLWLTRPLVARQLAGSPVTAPLVRTTTAPTLLRAGVKDNVLPTEAQAVVNFRILPGETIAGVQERVAGVLAGLQVEVAALEFRSEPSPVAPTDNAAFDAIGQAVREVFPEALVAPGLVIGATDNRHYAAVAPARYSFLPVEIDAADLQRIHGANERIAVQAHGRAVQFYIQLLRRVAGDRPAAAGMSHG